MLTKLYKFRFGVILFLITGTLVFSFHCVGKNLNYFNAIAMLFLSSLTTFVTLMIGYFTVKIKAAAKRNETIVNQAGKQSVLEGESTN